MVLELHFFFNLEKLFSEKWYTILAQELCTIRVFHKTVHILELAQGANDLSQGVLTLNVLVLGIKDI